jgi:hypothetical protein
MKRIKMRRILAVLAAMAAIAAISATVAFAQTPTPPPANQWGLGWECPGWGGSSGNYDYSASPMVQSLAATIGISAEDLLAELRDGKSVLDVAAGRVSEDALVNALLAPRKEMMDARVRYGYLTQEQADQMLELMAERVGYQLETPGFFAGAGRGGMMGSGGGMMGRGAGCGGCADGVGAFGGMMESQGGFGGMMGRALGGMMGGGSGPRFQTQSN